MGHGPGGTWWCFLRMVRSTYDQATLRSIVAVRPPRVTNPVTEAAKTPTPGMLTTARDYPACAGWRTEAGPFVGGSTPGWGQLETIPSAHMPNDPADR